MTSISRFRRPGQIRVAVFFFGIFLHAGIAQPQTPPQPTTTIRSQTELVLVPVVVNDKSGAHVHNLRLEDFAVEENGKRQKVATFEEVIAGPRSVSSQAKDQYTNYLPDDTSARRLTIILLDLVNTPYLTQQYARDELLKALSATLNTEDPKALLTLTGSGVRVLHGFTTDPAVLAAALRKANGDTARPGGVDADSLASDDAALKSFGAPVNTEWNMLHERSVIEMTLASFRDLAKAFEGVPGRKALIWASAGFPFLVHNVPAARSGTQFPAAPRVPLLGAEVGTEMFYSYEKTLRMLSSANIAIYSVDVRPMVNSAYRDLAPDPSGQRSYGLWAAQNHAASTTTLVKFALETGGKPWVDASDLARGFSLALDDSRSYYLLGYYRDRTATKPGWHQLLVKVAHSGADVRARAGFLIPEPSATPADQASDTELALSSPLDYTAVPLTLRLEPATEVAGKEQVNFVLTLPPGGFTIDAEDSNHAELEITAAVVDDQGKVKAARPQLLNMHLKPESVAKINAGGLVYHNSFDIPVGDYTGRFVVRDLLSGRIGSISAPLKKATTP